MWSCPIQIPVHAVVPWEECRSSITSNWREHSDVPTIIPYRPHRTHPAGAAHSQSSLPGEGFIYGYNVSHRHQGIIHMEIHPESLDDTLHLSSIPELLSCLTKGLFFFFVPGKVPHILRIFLVHSIHFSKTTGPFIGIDWS